jgi:hypothetical protein
MPCPHCGAWTCSCYGEYWRDEWSLERLRLRYCRTPGPSKEATSVGKIFFWLCGKRPTRKQLMELPRSQKP